MPCSATLPMGRTVSCVRKPDPLPDNSLKPATHVSAMSYSALKRGLEGVEGVEGLLARVLLL